MAIDPYPHLLFPACADLVHIGVSVPDVLMDMEKAIGEDLTRDFVRVWGGREFCVPYKSSKSGAAEYLREQFLGGRLLIPSGPASVGSRRAFTIYIDLKNGASLATIARRLGCNLRTVSNHKRRLLDLGLIKPTLTKESTL
jgi:hypothetical protein